MTPIKSKLKTLRVHALPLGILTVVALATGGPVAAQDRDHGWGETAPYTLEPSTHGNPEGIAFDKRTGAFFVGATGDGTIYRGTLRDPTAEVFIEGAPGREAAGMKVFRGKLYVAGAFSGRVSVYDIATRRLVASFENFGAIMLNDLVVTKSGDVFVTDSVVNTLWHITPEQVRDGQAAPGEIDAIAIDATITGWDFETFNFNGIVATNGGRSLIVVNSNNGKLFRIDLEEVAPDNLEAESIREIAVEPLFGDGLLLDKGHLIVVTFAPAPTLTFVRLNQQATRGTVVDRRTDSTLREPSTVARAGQFYLVVNADFGTSMTPFTVTPLARNDDDDDE